MKVFICLLVVAAVVAEPPRYRQARFRTERQELATENEKETTTKKTEAPYEASGFKPTKEFNLPSRQETPPSTSYGFPENSYSAPFNTYLTHQTEYGLPEYTETESVNKNETKTNKSSDKSEEDSKNREGGDTKETKGENKKEDIKSDKDTEVISAQGAYYVLLPDAQLQKVQFKTQNDLTNMAYTAQLQYKNENAPVYVYTAVPQYSNSAAAYIQFI